MKEFEKSVERAKKILEELMDPEITLQRSVELYKEGMEQLKKAQKMLEEAKTQIQIIQKEER